MRIAIIGSGIAGLTSAWLLSRQHDVTLFEANDYLGGHTHTHDIEWRGERHAIDTGFIVHNPQHYPLLTRLLLELRIDTQPTTMSFSVRNEASGLEYNASTLNALYCQRRNLLSPRFHRMVLDILRFYREAPALLSGPGPGPNLGDYLVEHGYGQAFRDEHLIPMASALWSSPSSAILSFPARYLVQFMANHQMLQVSRRPEWRVIRGGAGRYVQAMRERWSLTERLRTPVRAVRRRRAANGLAHGVEVRTDEASEVFEHVVMACHSNQSLALLADATRAEREVLGAMPYQVNETVLHTDASLLPRRRQAWAAWNAFIPREPNEMCTVSYQMNALQGLASTEPFIVTLNRTEAIDPARVLRRLRYEHPVYTQDSVAAQARRHEIQGMDRTWFAGAYWGWGFHEDGLRSAVAVASALGAPWDPQSAVLPSTPGSVAPAQAPGVAQGA